MRKPFVNGVGGVLTADIAVPDHERELAFYSKILTTGDVPLWRDDLMNNQGTPIIGLGERIPEYEMLPLQWMPHFQVADVGVSAARAIELGAKELMHSKTEDGQSQWAVFTDPVGAGFGLIPVVPKESVPEEQNEHVGRIAWLSLAVADASQASNFYQHVLGWNARPIETGDSEESVARFEMQIDNETAGAEVFESKDEATPAAWMLHLPVGDLAESLRHVNEGGGEVIKEDTQAGYAVVRDPIGVCVALCKL